MNEATLQNQRNIARAKLRILLRQEASEADVAHMEGILAKLEAANPETALAETPELTASAKIDINSLPQAVRDVIADLQAQRDAIHVEKSKLANQLHTVPDHINCRALTSQIMKLREDWKRAGDRVRSVMETGMIEAQQVGFDVVEYQANLPEDAEILRFRITQHQSNINKAEKRLRTVKDVVAIDRNKTKIAQRNAEIDLLRAKLGAIL